LEEGGGSGGGSSGGSRGGSSGGEKKLDVKKKKRGTNVSGRQVNLDR
jgi:hypothetical protein